MVLTCGNYNYGKQVYELDDINTIKLRDVLLELALKNGGNREEADRLSRAAELAVFDPETTNFSKIDTIKTWVAPKYHVDIEMMKNLQRYISYLVPQNELGYQKAVTVRTVNQGDEVKSFGMVFPTKEAIELSFLQHVSKLSKDKKDIITLEVGSAHGFVSWKVPLAFENGGTHYANELSDIVLNESFNNMVPNIFEGLHQKKLMRSIRTISGNCLEILDEHPELENKVDVIYVQNVEHFFNPVQHQKFLKLIARLLVPGGYAFLSANDPSALCFQDKTREVRRLILENEFNDDNENGIYSVYYAFLKYAKTGYDSVEITGYPNDTVELGDDLNCETRVRNFFTPKVYSRAISKASSNGVRLKIVETFFIDDMGRRLEYQDWNNQDPKDNNAAVIVIKQS